MPPDPASPPVARIRRAVADDLDALVALERQVFDSDLISRAQYRRHLDSASAAVLVATAAGRLLGSAVLFFRRNSRTARLYSLATAPEARGRGVAAALLASAERLARERRCHALRLEVRTGNVAARRLYERDGYQPRGRRRGYYEDGADALLYVKPLR
ncbi:acetyltransferase [Mizugakiibacter sediminis]|uniref:Acetyltransferase n=1 Tax=Mizugakiibacter sediminis TaxID=1475481 RepID=A0A0K8QK00_9GAMM|nr:GNAT family N-acetyltransferase [Mizugakiibacter sediminis]GAP64817.1 acetyltransferase [Mizugakiibacter sediminis]